MKARHPDCEFCNESIREALKYKAEMIRCKQDIIDEYVRCTSLGEHPYVYESHFYLKDRVVAECKKRDESDSS